MQTRHSRSAAKPKLSSLGPNFASTPQVRQPPGPTTRWRPARQAAAALLLAGLSAACFAQAESASAPSRQEVAAAVERLRADPNMPGSTTAKRLRFKERQNPLEPEKAEEADTSEDSDPGWWVDLFDSVAEGGRLVMWVLGGLAVAFVLVGLRHWVKARAEGAMAGPRLLPSHVRDLDIRPESLPDQIGAAASALWLRGEHRAALSLLYRGALSRLVHQHGVPVRAASTEGECVRLASARLNEQRSGFFERLVVAWQSAVYGGRLPESASVMALCADFDVHLSAAQPTDGKAAS